METKINQSKKILALTQSAIFIALATVLSFLPIYEMPMGGSVTLASMLPILFIGLQFGYKWGIGSAFVYSLITGYATVNICGFICILPYFNDNQHERLIPTAKEMFNFGSMIQLSTLVTMINRRISYFVMEMLLDLF